MSAPPRTCRFSDEDPVNDRLHEILKLYFSNVIAYLWRYRRRYTLLFAEVARPPTSVVALLRTAHDATAQTVETVTKTKDLVNTNRRLPL